MDINETQRDMVGPVARLVEFLRDLARAGQPRVLDVEGYELVRWLADVPSGVGLDRQAGPGDVVLSLAPAPRVPPPEPPTRLAPYIEHVPPGARPEGTPAGGTPVDGTSADPGPADTMPADPGPADTGRGAGNPRGRAPAEGGPAGGTSAGKAPFRISAALPADRRTPESRRAYEAWVARWEAWAEADRRVDGRRRWYDTLARVARLLDQQDDLYELVIGTGLLTCADGDTVVRHPLVTTPVEVAIDSGTGRIDLRVAVDAVARFGDRALLEGFDGFDGFDPVRAQPVRDELRSVAAHPLSDHIRDLLVRWQSLALGRSRPYEHAWEPPEAIDGTPAVRFAPVLLLRPRDRSSLIDYYDRMLDALSGPDARAPLGLAQLLVALEPDQRMAWLAHQGAAVDVVGDDPLFPLPANPEQRQILERLANDNGVVVQGPPGTGKTHTIANLLAALLARGQRVLVTSQKAQALRVLRDMLPPEARQLCVSLTDVARGGSRELDESVAAISDRYTNFSPTAHRDTVRRLEAARAEARRRATDLAEQMRRLRAAETVVYPEVAPGYAGTRGEIAERLRREAPDCEWMPLPLPGNAVPRVVSPGEVVPGATAWTTGSHPVITGSHPVVTGSHPIVTGANPVVTGSHPVVPPPPPPPPGFGGNGAGANGTGGGANGAGGRAPGAMTGEVPAVPTGATPVVATGEVPVVVTGATPVVGADGLPLPGGGGTPWAVQGVLAAPAGPPLAVAEAVELRRLLARATPQRRARARQALPDTARLPTPGAVARMVSDERHALAAAEGVASDLSRALVGLGADDVGRLRSAGATVAGALHRAGLAGPPDRWPPSWATRAVADGFAGRESGLWQGLGHVAREAGAAQEAMRAVGLRDVVLPLFDDSGPESLAGQAEAGRALRAHLAGGNDLKRRFAPAIQRRAARVLEGARVDGLAITTLDQLDAVLARLDAGRVAAALVARWADAGVALDPSLPLDRLLSRLADLSTRLDQVLRAVAVRADIEEWLAGRGVLVPLGTPRDWFSFTTCLEAVEARLAAERAGRALADEVARLEHQAAGAGAPPELGRLAVALTRRDPEAYDGSFRRLAIAPAERDEELRCAELAARLRAAHPVLADRLEATAGDEAWEARLATLPEAWAWAQARTWFDRVRHEGAEDRLAAQLDEALAQVAEVTARLAAEEAWGRCLGRMTAHQEQALRLYRESIAQRGRGTGKWASRYAAAAREAMVEARGAVPAWVMPLREVVDTVPPDPDSFDVVIVDEASQAGIEALFLLWLAPRVIVVGDERQCAPSLSGRGELQPVFDRLDDHLADVPAYRRLGFTPKSDLFSLLSTRFGTAVRLREHFRCMPEIIGWSSGTFYRDAPLVPLRQFGADRLVPLRSVYVRDGEAEGSSSRIRNRAEAEAIVAQVAACCRDPAYAGRTFGVIVLQGRGQVRLVDDLLEAAIPQVEREARRLRVGVPADFQGDERHVVFLSMVVSSRKAAVTHREWQRRFNVAASRAKDQMWLFHSVPPSELSRADLRRSLLTYMLNPPAALPSGDEVTGPARPDVDSPRLEPFHSLLQQRVFLALRERGYHVTPNVEVNGRRIDLVATGAAGRLAVECDGGGWYRAPEDQLVDVGHQLELRRAGWWFWRVRESEFNLRPMEALGPLWLLLERRGIRPDDPAAAPAAVATVAAGPEGAMGPRVEPGEPWEPLQLSDEESAEGLDDDPAAAELDAWAGLAPGGRQRPAAGRPDRDAATPQLVLGELPEDVPPPAPGEPPASAAGTVPTPSGPPA